MALVAAGCTGISIAPSCPNELLVGTSGSVRSNVIEPGAVPVYLWEAFPEEAGVFANPNRETTTFTGESRADAVIRLTASDGIYQVVSQCHIRVIDLVMSLTADPASPTAGQTVTVRCAEAGEDPAETITLRQTEGETLVLSPAGRGAVSFTTSVTGDYTFECVAESEGGLNTPPLTLTVTVSARGRR